MLRFLAALLRSVLFRLVRCDSRRFNRQVEKVSYGSTEICSTAQNCLANMITESINDSVIMVYTDRTVSEKKKVIILDR